MCGMKENCACNACDDEKEDTKKMPETIIVNGEKFRRVVEEESESALQILEE